MHDNIVKYNALDPYKALLENPNTFLVATDKSLDMFLTHIKEHYTADYTSKIAEDFGEYKVVKIIKGGNP